MTTILLLVEMERFRTVIVRRLGLFFEDGKREFLTEVLRRRLIATKQTGEKYIAYLETHSPQDELAALATELTVPETYFFRYNDQFRAFAEFCIPDRVSAQKTHRRLNLLSAGCASGEEAYSMAILVRERVDPAWTVSIKAFDVNPVVLAKAARAHYSTWALRETAPSVQRRWFRQEGTDSVLDESVRAAVHFEVRNFVDSNQDLWRPDTFDVIFCRNVLMYFTPEITEKVIARITRSLAPGGYLFLGHAETLRGYSNNFDLCHTHETFYYRRKVQLEPEHGHTASSDTTQLSAPINASRAAIDGSPAWVEKIRRSSRRIQDIVIEAPAVIAKPPPAKFPSVIPKSRMELGIIIALLQQEQFAEALQKIQSLSPESATDPDVLLLLAVGLAHAGRLAESEAACHRLLGIDGLNAGAHYVLALCREGLGDRQGAIEQDQVAVYLDPCFAMPRLHRGLLACKGNDSETARRELSQAIVLLKREDPLRLLLFGGGFNREALSMLCQSELDACGGNP